MFPTLKNPKTTLAGYFLLAASVLTIAGHYFGGQEVSLTDIQNVVGMIGAAAGLGHILAADGGH